MEVRGRIEEVRSSPGKGKAEGRLCYAIVVHGESFSCGFKPPAFPVGALVSFDVKVDGRFKSAWNIRPDSGQETSSPAPAIVAPSIAGTVDPLRLLAAAVLVSAWAREVEPGLTPEQLATKALNVAKQLEGSK